MRSLLLLPVLLTSCVTAVATGHRAGDSRRGERVARVGPTIGECTLPNPAARGAQYKQRSAWRLTDPLEVQALNLLCDAEFLSENAGSANDNLKALHAAFDDRRFDHLAAGFMLVDCARDRCSTTHDQVALGMLAWYADRLDPAEFDARFKAKVLSVPIATLMGERVRASKAFILAQAAQFDPRRRALFVEVPARAREERAAYFKKWSAFSQELDRLEPQLTSVTQADSMRLVSLQSAVDALRAKYLLACGAPECRHDPHFLTLTHHAITLRTLAGDTLGAIAEAEVLREPGSNRMGYAPLIFLRQYQALAAEREAHEAFERATVAGVRAKLGAVPPVKVDLDVAWRFDDTLPDPTGVLSKDQYVTTYGIIRDVQPGGPNATVTFDELVTRWDDADCVATKKLTRVDFTRGAATPVYEQQCRALRARSERNTLEPVIVPRAEAASLRPGDALTVLVDGHTRTGFVLRVEAKKKLLQTRGLRVGQLARVKNDG